MLYDTRWDAKVDPVAQTLTSAADYIEAHGWVQAFGRHGDARCVIGAIWSAAGLEFVEGVHPTVMGAKDRLRDVVGPFIESWNDARGRTKGEVVTALRAAARL